MAVFTLKGIEGGIDPLGVWTVPDGAARSFSVDEGVAPVEMPVWEIKLPADGAEAAGELAGTLEYLGASAQRLQQLQYKLAGLDPIGTSFGGTEGISPAEGQLLMAVENLRSPSFSAGEDDSWLMQQWMAFVEQVKQSLAGYARIQSDWGGAPLGATQVDWLGNFQTRWLTMVTPEGRDLHCQVVRAALTSRLSWFKLVGTVTVGAAGLALKASIPGGQLLLAPAVWRFVTDVIRDVKQIQ
jgi:hypothetical protein